MLDSTDGDPKSLYLLYAKAAHLFSQTQRLERNPAKKKLVEKNLTDLLDRAEEIKRMVNEKLIDNLSEHVEMNREIGSFKTSSLFQARTLEKWARMAGITTFVGCASCVSGDILQSQFCNSPKQRITQATTLSLKKSSKTKDARAM